MRKSAIVITALTLSLCSLLANAISEKDVVSSYVDLAHTVYRDSLDQAQQLNAQIDAFLVDPSAKTLESARKAWLNARVTYVQSEAFRFGNPVVDQWEGQVNAWPLDEGFIDYVSDEYQGELGNTGADANIIATTELRLGANLIDLTALTPQLLASLNELGGSEANVATGYHAIEFLLWGQDLNGTLPGAGSRPHTDFIVGDQCSNGNCQRRRDYLKATAELLVQDLTYIVGQWDKSQTGNYANEFLALPTKEAITRILFGMGSLALGELAGERMQVALEANSTEDEQDCFSDNTHNSTFYDWKGIANVYLSEYQSSKLTFFKGDSLAELVAERNNALAQKMQHQIAQTHKALRVIVTKAESKTNPMKFDQMIAEGNEEGAALINAAILELAKTTELIEQVATLLGITHLNPNLTES